MQLLEYIAKLEAQEKASVVSFKMIFRKCMSRMQYSLCKCEIECTGNCVVKFNHYLNQFYFNLISNFV
jgi:hypothetical protein